MFKSEHKFIGKLTGLAVLGPGLAESIQNWIEARELANPLPAAETAAMGAAIVRRLIRIGLIGLLFALIIPLLAWQQNKLLDTQNALIITQNTYLQKQIETQQEQIRQQTLEAKRVRRTQLLSIVYDTENCGDKDRETNCPMRASVRAREEAVVAIIQFDRENGQEETSLERARLANVELPRTDLGGVNFEKADLSNSSLIMSDLTGSDLDNAKLDGSKLFGARLSKIEAMGASFIDAALLGVDLSEADLSATVWGQANLQDANLSGAKLTGADLSQVQSLTQEQLDAAIGDSATQIPSHLNRPASWPDEEVSESVAVRELIYLTQRSVDRLPKSKEEE
ncbi:MAG: pentapeptide repeat-containing protein [bacterium]|nr:pentapeptide repeat-containing protein [bacterium]